MSDRTFRENAREEADRTPEYYRLRFGQTGKSDGAGNFDPNASIGLPDGYTWVLLDGDRDSIACLNLRVNPYSPGVDVKTEVNRRSGQREIRDVFLREGGSISANDLRTAAVPVPLAFDADKIAIGKVEPADRASTWVFVRAFNHDGGAFLIGENQYYDLASEISGISSGMQVMAIIGLDTAANELDVTVDSTERGLAYTYLPKDADDIATAAGIIRLAALVLRDGQTLAADCFGQNPPRYFDARQFLNLAGTVTTIAAEDVTYTPTSPLTATDVQEAIEQVVALLPTGGGLGDYVLIRDQKAQNANGGTFTSGADRTRDLNTKFDAASVASILKLAFTSGGTYEVLVGDTITGATSGATATVFDVELTSGSWAGGDAAGNLWLNGQTGTFSAENLNAGANNNVATIAADSTKNQIRLSAGTWRLDASAPAFRVGRHQAWMQNITDSTRPTEWIGSSEYIPNAVDGSSTPSRMRGRLTIASKKTFELQHRGEITMATNGFGVAGNFNAEIYSVVELVRE